MSTGKKQYKASTHKLVEGAKAFAEQQRAAGVTKEQAAQSLAEFLNDKVPLLSNPLGDWLSNVHVDTLKHPAQQHLITDHDLGPPKASRKYTSQQLLDMGYCGLYIKKGLGVNKPAG